MKKLGILNDVGNMTIGVNQGGGGNNARSYAR
jgi:hypothetical protein